MNNSEFSVLLRKHLKLKTPFRIIKRKSHPIIINSYGVIYFNRLTNSVLLIQRRFSIPYVEIINGTYRLSNLAILLKNLKLNELIKLYNCSKGEITFTKLFEEIFNCFPDIKREHKFTLIHNLIIEYYEYIIQRGEQRDNENEWLFPKGRIERSDVNLRNGAMRELFEETGESIKSSDIFINENITEEIIGTNSNLYRTTYWLVVTEENILHSEKLINGYEVSMTKWATIEEAQTLLKGEKLKTFNEALKLFQKI